MRKKFEYKWVILILCFLVIFCSLGFCSGTKSLYLNSITGYLNIPRSLFSINDSIRFITTAVLSVFFGALYSKFGARKLIALGFLCLTGSCLVYSFAENIFAFYAGGFLLGTGLAFCSSTMTGLIISHWFKTRLGTYTGLVLAANGLGTAVISQFLEPMIDSAPDGYKNAYRFTALLLLIIGAAVVILLREKPEAKKQPLPPKKRPQRSAAWVGMSLRDARRKPYFYVLLVWMFMSGAVLQSVSGVAIPHIRDVVLTGADPAFDSAFITTALGLHAIVLTAAKFLSGVSYDHLGMRWTMLVIHLIALGSTVMLVMVQSGAYTLAFIYEILGSFAMPLETIIPFLIISDLFGEKEYAHILGVSTAVLFLGFAAGTPLTNLVYDKLGTYRPALYVIIGLLLFMTVSVQWVLVKGEKVKREILARGAD
ncbi:MAG: MFS transporter [Clostridia bacterium]|nr:MFS transporter [Clostridia bacterium]